MGLGFGLLSAQIRHDETDWTRAYEQTISVAETAERLGFESVWTTEHHFIDDGYMPSLAVVSAAIAARTTSIEIGTGVILAPLHDPIRLAEDAATVELLSGGRFTLGLGLGWSDIEFEALGIDMRRRGKAMSEILDILPRAWSGTPFHHQGEMYQYPEVAVRPTPSGRIPIVIGGSAEPAVRRAARLADGLFANASARRLPQMMDWARDERAKAGRSMDDFRVLHYSLVFPGDTMEQAWADGGAHLWSLTWKYADMVASAARPGPPPEAPPFTPELRQELERRTVFVGPPDHLIEQLQGVRTSAGGPVDLVARSFFHTLEDARQIELMERLAAEVAPFV